MRFWSRALAALLVSFFIWPLFGATLALAHERREVGRYTLVVGFLNEPALADQPNGVDLRVTNTETKEPVNGVEQSLSVEVMAGGRTLPLKLRAVFGQPGKYAADFVPTRPGQYTFRFVGHIEGTPVDQRFESGPGRFNDVESVAGLQFPERGISTVEASQQLQALQAQAAQAQLVGFAGLAVGILGLLAGGFAIITRPRQPAAAPPHLAAPAAGSDD